MKLRWVSSASLSSPNAVAVDGAGNVYIADTSNNRVLEFGAPLAPDPRAHLVFGQSSFLTDQCNNFPLANANILCAPLGVAADSAGNLYVADNFDSRVLIYQQPLVTPTRTPAATPSRTPARTLTRTPTATPTRTHTRTPTPTATRTPIPAPPALGSHSIYR
ncbi:MAG TPA: hypothetical protein VGY99_07690 [Candidatus Binataceae bacterium]|nr:hypothetical protein [Candidatus Binataceae bacterium]